MFKKLGNLKNLISKKIIKINLNELKSETNLFENIIIYKINNHIKVYDRICDHQGGKIISKEGVILCPIHMWKFDPSSGSYENGVKKKELNYSINNDCLNIEILSHKPELSKSQKKLSTKIRFFNHAFLKITGNNFSFATDPWAIGPAFNTGWWLKSSTKNDWVDNLNNSNFIYISHNHPDHLHQLTLEYIDKNIPIVVPNFISKSTEKFIDELGFKNIQVLDFNMQYKFKGSDLNISLLKSGDFREDSGIYFSNGNFTGLLGVDSNQINFGRLPNVNFYASSFAGGASGYPLMFENYKMKEQIEIVSKNQIFLKKKNYDYIKKISPNFYMPYAGFFDEKLKRDKKIKNNNKKNSIENYQIFCEKNNIKLLNVLKNDLYEFSGEKLIKEKNIDREKTKDLKPEKYLEYYKKEFSKVDEKYIQEYFTNSGFKDNLLLYICLTDDDFNLINKNYLIDFSKSKISYKKISQFHEKFLNNNCNLKKLTLKIRKESFLNTIYNKSPWEDLLIGFQCKVLRNPNLYNVNFWHYFTNEYTTSKSVRSVTTCGSCQKLSQFYDNELYKIITE